MPRWPDWQSLTLTSNESVRADPPQRSESHTRHGSPSCSKSTLGRQDCDCTETSLSCLLVKLRLRARKRQPLRTRQTRRYGRAMSAEVKIQLMNSSEKNAYVRKLVEQYGPREIFRFFAARILLPEMTQELQPSSEVPMESRKIIINEQVLRKLRTRPRASITLPSQEEVFYWLRRWRQREGQDSTC